MNEKDARAYAAAKGLTVSKVRRIDDRREITVGTLTVYHPGVGGKACWNVAGHESVRETSLGREYSGHSYVGLTICRAVNLQTAAAAAPAPAAPLPTSVTHTFPAGSCEVCGVDITHDRSRCTNRRCSRCHSEHCTPGGATDAGHGRGSVAVLTTPLVIQGFNTGRLYTANGQRIAYCVLPSGNVALYDRDRMVDYVLAFAPGANVTDRDVLRAYDGHGSRVDNTAPFATNRTDYALARNLQSALIEFGGNIKPSRVRPSFTY